MLSDPEETGNIEFSVENIPPATDRAALTITVQSWATPVVGLVMLVIGLLGGYFGRPFLAPASSAASGSTQTVASAQSSSASQAELMQSVIEQTRHFKGVPDAPVTIIEFSDFQ
jgi:hypothetical protein